MNHFQQSLTIAAPPSAVYAALGTVAGLRGWWTPACTGTAAVGGTLEFHFGATSKTMRVERMAPDREVRWSCIGAHINVDAFARKDEWVGTAIVFRLADAGAGHTRLDFEHIGLDASLECYGVCEKGWQQFLGSLQDYAASGTGRPYSDSNHVCTASMERREAA